MTKTLTKVSTKTKIGITVGIAALGLAAATLPFLLGSDVKFIATKQTESGRYVLKADYNTRTVKMPVSFGFYYSDGVGASDCKKFSTMTNVKKVSGMLTAVKSNIFTSAVEVSAVKKQYFVCPFVETAQKKLFLARSVSSFTSLEFATPTPQPVAGSVNWNIADSTPSGVAVQSEKTEIARINLSASSRDVDISQIAVNIAGTCKLSNTASVLITDAATEGAYGSRVYAGDTTQIVTNNLTIAAGTTKVLKIFTNTLDLYPTEGGGECSLLTHIKDIKGTQGEMVSPYALDAKPLSFVTGYSFTPVAGTVTLSKVDGSPVGIQVPRANQTVLGVRVAAQDKDVTISDLVVEARQGGDCNLLSSKVSLIYVDSNLFVTGSESFADLSGTRILLGKPMLVKAGSDRIISVIADTTSCSIDSTLQFNVKGVGVLDNQDYVMQGLPVFGGAMMY